MSGTLIQESFFENLEEEVTRPRFMAFRSLRMNKIYVFGVIRGRFMSFHLPLDLDLRQ